MTSPPLDGADAIDRLHARLVEGQWVQQGFAGAGPNNGGMKFVGFQTLSPDCANLAVLLINAWPQLRDSARATLRESPAA